jgi:hypothetical protein
MPSADNRAVSPSISSMKLTLSEAPPVLATL